MENELIDSYFRRSLDEKLEEKRCGPTQAHYPHDISPNLFTVDKEEITNGL